MTWPWHHTALSTEIHPIYLCFPASEKSGETPVRSQTGEIKMSFLWLWRVGASCSVFHPWADNDRKGHQLYPWLLKFSLNNPAPLLHSSAWLWPFPQTEFLWFPRKAGVCNINPFCCGADPRWLLPGVSCCAAGKLLLPGSWLPTKHLVLNNKFQAIKKNLFPKMYSEREHKYSPRNTKLFFPFHPLSFPHFFHLSFL